MSILFVDAIRIAILTLIFILLVYHGNHDQDIRTVPLKHRVYERSVIIIGNVSYILFLLIIIARIDAILMHDPHDILSEISLEVTLGLYLCYLIIRKKVFRKIHRANDLASTKEDIV
jgi:hypothetical protein